MNASSFDVSKVSKTAEMLQTWETPNPSCFAWLSDVACTPRLACFDEPEKCTCIFLLYSAVWLSGTESAEGEDCIAKSKDWTKYILS